MKKRLLLLLPVILSLSCCGCLSFFNEQESSRVHSGAIIAKKMTELQNKNDSPETKEFIKANARAWATFDQKVNGVKNAVITPESEVK